MNQIKLPFYIEAWKSEYVCPKCKVFMSPIHDRKDQHFCSECGRVFIIREFSHIVMEEKLC